MCEFLTLSGATARYFATSPSRLQSQLIHLRCFVIAVFARITQELIKLACGLRQRPDNAFARRHDFWLRSEDWIVESFLRIEHLPAFTFEQVYQVAEKQRVQKIEVRQKRMLDAAAPHFAGEIVVVKRAIPLMSQIEIAIRFQVGARIFDHTSAQTVVNYPVRAIDR